VVSSGGSPLTDPELVAAAVDAYRRDGFALLPGAIGVDRLAEIRAGCDAAWSLATADLEPAPGALEDRRFARGTIGGARVTDRLDPVVDLDPRLEALACDPIVIQPVAALIGEPVALLKSKLIWKGPGVDGYGPHQDQAYYRHAGIQAERCVSVLVPLDPFSVRAGPLEVVPGSHGDLVETVEGSEDPAPDACASFRWMTPRQDPGDLGFLHPLALHRSTPNRSRQHRRILFLTYASGDDRAVQAERLAQIYADRFKASIDAGGTLTRPARNDRRGGRSRR
jgi:2-aminoethylphosphonate dioxygenase